MCLLAWSCSQVSGGRDRRKRKLDRVVDMANKYDVVCLQEVHGCASDLSELRNLIPGHLVVGSFCENVNSGGVAIIVHSNLVSSFGGCWSQRDIIPGRLVILDLVDYGDPGEGVQPENDTLCVCCVHVVPAWNKQEQFSFVDRLRNAIPRDTDPV